MSEFFLAIVNMSISASWIVLAVLLLRLLLKKAPKWITVLLWGIVAVRLICPFTIESVMSLIPSAETISPEIMMDATPEINSGIPILNNTINPVISESFAPDPAASANPLQILIPLLSVIWVVGISGMLVYIVVSYFKVKRKIGTAVLLRDNIFQSENVVSPFVLGFFKPKIYLPFNMYEQDTEHVVAHEQAHICRKDHWWKPFGFLLLALHWFNPLMWLGYVLLCRDIELACDEKVIKELNTEQKADYSQALLTCSVNRRMIAACPLAFGEVGVKNRVKTVLNYKKPAFWIIAIAIVASIVVAVCFLTNPKTTIDDELSVFLDTQIASHHSGYKTDIANDNFIAVHHKVLGVDKTSNKTIVYLWVMYREYSFDNGEIKLEVGAHVPTVITAKHTGEHGHYELVEYWEPHDGELFESDIKDKFPVHLHAKALDSQLYVNEQIAFCENAAKEYFSSINNQRTGFEGVYVTLESHNTDEGGQTYFNIVWHNETNSEVTYGEGFSIEQKIGAEWKEAEFNDEEFFNMYGILLEPQSTKRKTYITEHYDLSKVGTYRILLPFSVKDGDNYIQYKTWAVFNIEDLINKPPMMTVSCRKASVNAWLGTYSWTYKNYEDGTAQSTNADSSHPLTRIDEIPTLNILPTTISSIDPRLATVQFAIAPDKIEVKCYKVDEKNTNSGKVIPVEGTSFKLKDGKYLYEVIVEWTKSEQYSGKAYYAFQAADADLEIVDINGVMSTDTNLTSAISSVLNEKYNKAGKPDGLIHIENYYLLAHETASGTPLKGNSGHMEIANVYLLVYHMKYSVNGEHLEEHEGDFVPTAITFAINKNGEYTLDDYWTPQTGTNYEKDVRNKFPGSSAAEALNTEKYAEDLIKENWRLANEYFSQIKNTSS